MIKTFVINLEQSKDRWRFMKKQLDNLGIEYERIEGTNPRIMEKSEIEKIYDKELARKTHFPNGLALGSLGCAHSHFKIYKKIVEEHIPLSLIFEDDVIISEEVKKLYDNIDKNNQSNGGRRDYLSMNYGYFGLGYFLNFVRKINSEYLKKKKIGLFLLYFMGGIMYTVLDFFPRILSKFMKKTLIVRRYRPFYLTGGYFITYEGAKKLLSIHDRIFTVADYLPERYRKKSKLKFYVTVPVLCVQDVKTFGTTNF